MLGVALPGIAPTRPPDGAAAPSAVVAQSPAAPVRHRPHAATLPLQVQYVPPPEPLRELAAPPPPKIVRKKGGFPLAAVALVMGVLVLAGGVALALLWKGAPPITGLARTTPEGKDVLHLTCDAKSCKDGTVVTLGGAKTVFTAGEADLPLATPLHVGDNTFDLMVDRPGMGRDETVRLVVPVAYRVSADVTTMGASHPSITIRVEAHPGTAVTVDGKPLALDANGAGAYAIDETSGDRGAGRRVARPVGRRPVHGRGRLAERRRAENGERQRARFGGPAARRRAGRSRSRRGGQGPRRRTRARRART